MDVKVLGLGCSKCRLTVEMIERVAKALSVNIQITKIEDPDEIKRLGGRHDRRSDRAQRWLALA